MRALLLPLLLSVVQSAHALEPYTCRNGRFPSYEGDISAALVTAPPGSRVHFRNDEEGCPKSDTCVQQTYLVNGDKVLLSHKEEGWACAWYFGKKREFVGWLPKSSLEEVADASAPKQTDWTGRWLPIFGENVIHIATHRSSGQLRVEGSANWRGGTTSSGYEIVNWGGFDGLARPHGTRLVIGDPKKEYDCVVRMQLVADSLVVTDNSHCGGMNVRFDDVYRRRP